MRPSKAAAICWVVVHLPSDDTLPVLGARVGSKGRITKNMRTISLLSRKTAEETARQLNADEDKQWVVIKLKGGSND